MFVPVVLSPIVLLIFICLIGGIRIWNLRAGLSVRSIRDASQGAERSFNTRTVPSRWLHLIASTILYHLA